MEKIRSKIYNTLRKSEKYTQTDMVYLAKGGFWLFLSQIVSAMSSFILAIIFANFLPIETYGNYKFILSVSAVLAIPTLTGINTSLTKSIAQGKDGSTITAFKQKIYWGSLSSIASIITSFYFLQTQNIEFSISFLIIAIFLPFFDSFTIYQSILNGKKKFYELSNYNSAITLISLLSILTTLFFTQSLPIVVASYFIPYTILRFIAFKQTTKKYLENKEIDSNTIKYGKHLTVINIMSTLSTHVDKIFIFNMLGPAQVAIYSFAIAFPEQIRGLCKIVSSIAFPKFSESKISDLEKSIWKKLKLFSLLLLITTFLYIISAKLLFQLFFPIYAEYVIYSQLFALSIMSFSQIILNDILNAHEQTRKLYILNLINSITKILFIIIFTYYFGLTGTIFAWIINRYLILIISIILVRSFFKNNKVS